MVAFSSVFSLSSPLLAASPCSKTFPSRKPPLDPLALLQPLLEASYCLKLTVFGKWGSWGWIAGPEAGGGGLRCWNSPSYALISVFPRGGGEAPEAGETGGWAAARAHQRPRPPGVLTSPARLSRAIRHPWPRAVLTPACLPRRPCAPPPRAQLCGPRRVQDGRRGSQQQGKRLPAPGTLPSLNVDWSQ